MDLRGQSVGSHFVTAQQQVDGSFPTDSVAQPGVTSLCVLAFMAHGHNPGNGPYGERLDRAITYIADCQKLSGLIMLNGSDEPEIDRRSGTILALQARTIMRYLRSRFASSMA